MDEPKRLFIFPAGTGGLPINTDDYKCLASEQYLNDVIIDFYMLYLKQKLPKTVQDRIHVFSTFFYHRLTAEPASGSEQDSDSGTAETRHLRVKNWTKNINLFEKDFIFIPINRDEHWLLAVICFPNNVSAMPLKNKNEKDVRCSPRSKPWQRIVPYDDSSDDEQNDTLLSSKNNSRPGILIFDSMGENTFGKVASTLREYLACEYKIKCQETREFSEDSIKTIYPKVPEQPNDSDCGIYILEYTETFLKNCRENYESICQGKAIKFEEQAFRRKRGDIAGLIKDLTIKYGEDVDILPNITVPICSGNLARRKTMNGKRKVLNSIGTKSKKLNMTI